MSSRGANTAERVPTAMRASPSRRRSQASIRSLGVSPLWSTATSPPNRF